VCRRRRTSLSVCRVVSGLRSRATKASAIGKRFVCTDLAQKYTFESPTKVAVKYGVNDLLMTTNGITFKLICIMSTEY
jgi:hypothetical protein